MMGKTDGEVSCSRIKAMESYVTLRGQPAIAP